MKGVILVLVIANFAGILGLPVNFDEEFENPMISPEREVKNQWHSTENDDSDEVLIKDFEDLRNRLGDVEEELKEQLKTQSTNEQNEEIKNQLFVNQEEKEATDQELEKPMMNEPEFGRQQEWPEFPSESEEESNQQFNEWDNKAVNQWNNPMMNEPEFGRQQQWPEFPSESEEESNHRPMMNEPDLGTEQENGRIMIDEEVTEVTEPVVTEPDTTEGPDCYGIIKEVRGVIPNEVANVIIREKGFSSTTTEADNYVDRVDIPADGIERHYYCMSFLTQNKMEKIVLASRELRTGTIEVFNELIDEPFHSENLCMACERLLTDAGLID